MRVKHTLMHMTRMTATPWLCPMLCPSRRHPASASRPPALPPTARPGPADLPAAPAARPPARAAAARLEERSRRVNPQAPHAGGRLAPPTRTGESALAPFDSQTSLMAVCVAVMNIIMCMSSTSRYL